MKRAVAATISVCVLLFFLVGCDQIPGAPPDDEIIAAFHAIMEGIEDAIKSELEPVATISHETDIDRTQHTYTFDDHEVEVSFGDGVTTVTLNGTVTRSVNGTIEFSVDLDCESDDFSRKLSVELEMEQEPEEDVEIKLFKVNGVTINFDALDD